MIFISRNPIFVFTGTSMANSISHNPLNDLAVDSAEMILSSEELVQVILHRIESRHEKPLRKHADTVHPAIVHCVEHRDVQDEAQD